MLECERIRPLLPLLLLGDAAPEEQAATEAHLAVCAACRAERERVAWVVDEVRRDLCDVPIPEPLPPDLWWRSRLPDAGSAEQEEALPAVWRGVTVALQTMDVPEHLSADRIESIFKRVESQSEKRRVFRKGRPLAAIAAAAAMLLVGAGIWYGTTRPSPSAVRRPSPPVVNSPVAMVAWKGAWGLELPQELPGRVRLAKGEARVRLPSGVELALLGPLEMEIDDGMDVRLAKGRLVAWVPQRASGFTVRTAELEIWDIGTVFGVSAGEGRADVFVFKGSVQVNEASGEPVDLCEAGQGVHALAGVRPVKVAADWPEARKVFAAVSGTAALASPGAAFETAHKVVRMWAERYEPKVVSPRSKARVGTERSSSGTKEKTEMRHLTKTMAAMAMGVATLGSVGTANAQVTIHDPLAYWSFGDAGTVLSNRVTSSPYHDASVLLGQPSSGIASGASGIVGNAMVLNGASGIRLPYNQDNLGTSFTVSLWYWQLTNNTRQCVYQTRDNWVASYEASGANSVFTSHVGQEWAGQTTTRLNEWVHLAHTFSTVGGTNTLSVYTNGVLQLTKNVDADRVFGANQVRGLHVGAYRTVSADSRCFKGMIDEVALWGRALSAAEVLAVYQRGAGGQELEVTARPVASVSLASGPLEFVVQADDGIPDGMFNNGWLTSAGTGQPGNAPDTARAASAPVGSALPDTAGHAEGPFNADKIADMRWRVPLTEGSALKRLPRGDFTAEAWFRTTSTTANVLFGTYPGTGAGVVNLQLEGNSQAMLYWRTNATATAERVQVTPPESLRGRDGNWHHLAGVRSGTTAYLYMDGVQIGSTNVAAGAFDLGGSHLYIGQDGRGNFGLFNGEIGDARLWTRALSSNEVATLATFGRPGGAVSKSGLLAEYALYNPYTAMSAYPGYRIALTPQLRQIPQTNFTYEAKFRTTDAGRGILVGNYVDDVTLAVNNLELYTNNEIRFLQRSASTWVAITRSAGAVNTRDGAWHRVAAVRRDGQVFLYLDGQQLGAAVSDTLGPYTFAGTYLGLGRDFRASPVYPFNGELAQARVWSRALSAAEVAGLAASEEVPSDGLVAQYAPFPTNSLRRAGFPGNSFLRSYTTGTNTATLVFTGLPRHTKIGLGLLLAQLDSLEPLLDGECFAIKLDGAEVLSVGLGPNQGSEPQVGTFRLFGEAVDVNTFKSTLTLGGQDLFGCGETVVYNDHVYDLSMLAALQNIPHSGDTLVLELTGIQNMGGENEGFGVDQVKLTVHPAKGTLIRLL